MLNQQVTVRTAKTQISLGIRADWSESSLCAQWVATGPRFAHADSEDSDQTGRMPKLIWVFAGRTLILLVFSCLGSYFKHPGMNSLIPVDQEIWSALWIIMGRLFSTTTHALNTSYSDDK